MNFALTRRDLLRRAAAVPLAGAAGGLRWLPGGDDAALVVLELEGGNDGLNTVIPLDDARWAAARPQLAQVRNGAHALGGGFALHPALAALARRCRDGQAAIVHGAGYPGPDRSHFRSRDIWHVADPAHVAATAATTGWLGRAADWLAARGAAVPGLGVGSDQLPLVLQGRSVVVPVLQRLQDYQLLTDAAEGKGALRREAVLEVVAGARPPAGDALGAFLAEVAATAVAGAERLRERLAAYRPRAQYPDTELGRKLALLARVLVSGFGTRLAHVTLGGFDTHARQLPAHDALLRQLDGALGALLGDLDAHGALGRTVVLVHSEFGRRVAQNKSQGTDHGAAAPVFVCGGGVKPGCHGRAPDLGDLDQGDLRATCDFRALYAALLRRLRVDEVAVLGARHDGVDLFA
jgi:uncharacterized protein (DUF1501 family)